MKPRDYQEAAIDHLFGYFEEHTGNPLVAMPTGTGKSLVIGEFIKRALRLYPGTRVMMLTHVKELIEQNMKNLLAVWPSAPAGIYSAGLRRKEAHAPITFAGIQSVYRKAEKFGHIDLILIDEAHLVSNRETTSYRTFINALLEINPKLKIIGLTATPYRLKHGMLTDPGGLFDDVCFDLTSREAFNWMIAQGWIAPLIPKQTKNDLSSIISNVKIQAGEYNQKQLQEAVDVDEVTYHALREALELASDRNHWLVFATGIEHAEHIAGALVDLGIPAAAVHSRLTSDERDKRLRDYKAGRLRAVVNNNVLTTGFDFPKIDCILMLRPTQSPGLWVQMLGRGTRPAPGKTNCLVLDFAGNTKKLGPINDPVIPRQKKKGPPGIAPVRLCEVCGCYSHASCRYCENCGNEFPRHLKIEAAASTEELIAGEMPKIEKFAVDRVTYQLHQKEGRPDSMRVDYYCGLRRFKEYVTIEHSGYAQRTARQWWQLRTPHGVFWTPKTTAEGLAAVDFIRVPKQIFVIMKPKWPEISGYVFDD